MKSYLSRLFRIEPRDQGRVELLIVRLALAFVLANNFLFDLRPLAQEVYPPAVQPLKELTFFSNTSTMNSGIRPGFQTSGVSGSGREAAEYPSLLWETRKFLEEEARIRRSGRC